VAPEQHVDDLGSCRPLRGIEPATGMSLAHAEVLLRERLHARESFDRLSVVTDSS